MECELETNYKKEKEILDFFRELSKYPEEFKKHFFETGITDRARILAFIQTRDSILYKKVIKEILHYED